MAPSPKFRTAEGKQNALVHGCEVGSRSTTSAASPRCPWRVRDVALHFVAGTCIHGEQCRHVGDGIMRFQIGRLISDSSISRGVATLACTGEEHHLVKQFIGDLFVHAAFRCTFHEDAAMCISDTFFLPSRRSRSASQATNPDPVQCA